MKSSADTPPVKTVDEYLAMVDEPALSALLTVREYIFELVPDAEEVISYMIPTVRYHGALVGYAAFKGHCSFYIMSTAMAEVFREELKGYDSSGTTVRFQPGAPLPADLIHRIVAARMAENEGKAAARKKKKG